MIDLNFLAQYINPIYLRADYIKDLQETVKSKPLAKYLVLDNFLREDFLDKLMEEHKSVDFNIDLHKSGFDNNLMPYHGSSGFCLPDSTLGKFVYSAEWHKYALNLFNLFPLTERETEVELRWHDSDAKGFWMHTDTAGGGAGPRDLVITLYFNKDWKIENGGMLQFWKMADENLDDTPYHSHEEGLSNSMDFFNQNRIKVTPAGEYPYTEPNDFILYDQVLPIYNRIFLLNAQAGNDYHSVSPSHGKIREGFVQRLLAK